jgi:ADP-ribose pyrophosphatase
VAKPKDLTERFISGERVYDGSLLKVHRDRVRLPDGREGSREYIRHPGACAIVALFDDGSILLERQYRYPNARVFIEIPAGKLEPGEPHLETAKRELLEETGYVAREWAYAFTMYPTVAYSDEAIEIWFARGLEHRGARLDEGEFLEVITASPEEFLAWCRDGRIVDSKTLAAAVWVQNVLAGTWKLDWTTPPSLP